MTRLSTVDTAKWDAELAALVDAENSTPFELGEMRILAHTPGIAKGMATFVGALRLHRSLPERLVELLRLRIAFHNQCRRCMAIRYEQAVADGLSNDLVCSLENPPESDDLSEAEKVAIDFADRFATDHLSIDDQVYDSLRIHFIEAQIVELGTCVAFYVGFGRLASTWDFDENLPDHLDKKPKGNLAPWGGHSIEVR